MPQEQLNIMSDSYLSEELSFLKKNIAGLKEVIIFYLHSYFSYICIHSLIHIIDTFWSLDKWFTGPNIHCKGEKETWFAIKIFEWSQRKDGKQ